MRDFTKNSEIKFKSKRRLCCKEIYFNFSYLQFGMDGLFFARLDYQDRSERKASKTMEFLWEASANLGISYLHVNFVISSLKHEIKCYYYFLKVLTLNCSLVHFSVITVLLVDLTSK